MPLMVSMFNTTVEKSIVTSAEGSPSTAIRPPCVMVAIMSRSASGLPDISKPTSKPSCIPSARCASASVERSMLTARVAPKDPASASHQHVLAQHRERQCGVDGVAKWIKDRRHFGRNQFPVHPDVRGRQRHVLRECAVEMNADPPSVDA